jgi:GT2 family glycosyltransferase
MQGRRPATRARQHGSVEAPDISVVIPTLARPEALERCIAALVAQDFPRHRFEIVIADAAGEARVRQIAGRWAMLTQGAPLIRYVPADMSPGPAAARNVGWRAAQGEVIAFINDESLPRRNWLSEGWKAMASGAIAAAGVVEAPAGGRAPDVELDARRAGEPGIAASNCFVQRQSLRAVGGFDERFAAAWDDARDLQFTLAEVRGELVAAPAAVVERPALRGGWDATLRQYRKLLYDALLFKKHPRLYRERVRRTPPWSYYLIVAALLAIVAGALLQAPALAWVGLVAWSVLTLQLVIGRWRASGAHLGEIAATSVAIPPIAVFWRLAGALRFRVLFF